MNAVLWGAQGILAVVFALSGSAKLTMSRQLLLDTGQTGIAVFPMPVVRFTAAMELLAAMGLIAPRLFGVATVLTPAAAIGLCAVMVGAAYAHSQLREPRSVALNVALFGLALFVALGRLI